VSPEECTDVVDQHAGIDNACQPLQSLPIDFVRTTGSHTPLQDTSNNNGNENNKSEDENNKENVIPTSASTTRLDTVCNKRLLERLSTTTTTTTTKRQRTTCLSELVLRARKLYIDLSLTQRPIKSTLMALQRRWVTEACRSKNSDRVLLQHPTILPMVPPGFLKCSPICLARLKLEMTLKITQGTQQLDGTVIVNDCHAIFKGNLSAKA
jgi:hypothetical protein